MTMNGDAVCKLIQMFPVLLILAQKNNRCLTTPLLYKPPPPTHSPEYYEALDALFQTIYSGQHDCHGHYAARYRADKSLGYIPGTHYPSHGDPCHEFDPSHGYPTYGYKRSNIYNLSHNMLGHKSYAPGSQIYTVNHHKYKVVLKKPRFFKRKMLKLQALTCLDQRGAAGTCIEAGSCRSAPHASDAQSRVRCPSNSTHALVCCTNEDAGTLSHSTEQELVDDDNDDGTTGEDMKVIEDNSITPSNVTSDQESLESIVDDSVYDIETTGVASETEDNGNYTEDVPRPPLCGSSNLSVTDVEDSALLEPGDVPWMALLGYRSGRIMKWQGGGSLLTHRHVLTTASCVLGRRTPYKVRLGWLAGNNISKSESVVDVPVELAISHPQYNRTTRHNDIAILLLVHRVVYSDYIRPACLPLDVTRFTRRSISKSSLIIVDVTNGSEGKNPGVSVSATSLLLATRCKRGSSRGVLCVRAAGSQRVVGRGAGLLQRGGEESPGLGTSTLVGLVTASRPPAALCTRVTIYLQWILDTLNSR